MEERKHYDHEDDHIDGLMQERRNSSALAMELHLSCTNPSIYARFQPMHLLWEHLCSANTLRWPMITHTIYSYQIPFIPSQNYIVQRV